MPNRKRKRSKPPKAAASGDAVASSSNDPVAADAEGSSAPPPAGPGPENSGDLPPARRSLSRQRGRIGITEGGKKARRRRAREREGKGNSEKWLERVTKQLEFYFGDANLRRDKYMRRSVEAGDGYLELEALLRFNRIMVLGVRDVNQLAEAIRKSELLELTEDATKVRRNFDKAPMEKIDPTPRTIYVEGLPLTFDLDNLNLFFSQCGTVKLLDLPYHKETGEPRGYCFVEFSSIQEAEDAKRKLHGTWPLTWPVRFDGKTLRVMPKLRWLDLCEEFKVLHRSARSSVYGARSQGEPPDVVRTETATASVEGISSTIAAASSSSSAPSSAVAATQADKSTDSSVDGGKRIDGDAQKTAEKETPSKPPLKARMPRGCVLKISGFPQPQTLLSVRQFAEHAVPVEYCDLPDPYGSCAHLRLKSPEDCKLLLDDLARTGRMLGWLKPKVEILNPVEQDAYWDDVERRQAARDAARPRPIREHLLSANLTRKTRGKLARPLRSMLQNPQGAIRRGPAKTSTILRYGQDPPTVAQMFASPVVRSDGFKASFIDTVGGNGRFVQAGFARPRRRARKEDRLQPVSGARVRRAAAKAASIAKKEVLSNFSVPPPSPFIMPSGAVAKKKAKPGAGVSSASFSSFSIPPPSPFAKPAGRGLPPSPRGAGAASAGAGKPGQKASIQQVPGIPPPSPFSMKPKSPRQPPIQGDTSSGAAVGETEKGTSGAPTAEGEGVEKEKRADSMLQDSEALDDILGLLDE